MPETPSNERIVLGQADSPNNLYISDFPPLPAKLKQIVPEMADWEAALKVWLKNAIFNIRNSSGS